MAICSSYRNFWLVIIFESEVFTGLVAMTKGERVESAKPAIRQSKMLSFQ